MKTDLLLAIKPSKPPNVSKPPVVVELTFEQKTVLELYRANQSYTDISKVIGKSRAAVAGIIGRIRARGLLADKPPSNEGKRRRPILPVKKPEPDNQIITLPVTRMPAMFNPPKDVPEVRSPFTDELAKQRVRLRIVDGPTEVTFEDLAPHHCRYPHGDPRNSDFRFCGKPRMEKRPYCVEHVKLSMNPHFVKKKF